MNKILLIVTILLAIYGSVAQEEETIVNKVQTGLTFASSQTSAAADAFSLLKNVSNTTTGYIKFLGPVAAFLDIAIKVHFKPETDEMKALKLLRDQSAKQYLNVKEDITALGENINFNELWTEWSKNVNLPISELNDQLKELLNETEPTPMQIEEFKQQCKDLNKGPRTILNFINLRTVDECTQVCDDLQDIWAEADMILENIMVKINHWKWEESEFQLAKSDFIRKVALMGCGSKTTEIMRAIRYEMEKSYNFASIEDAFEQLRKLEPILFRKTNATPSCIITAAILKGDFQKEYMENFIDTIRIGATHAAVLGFYCSNITNSGSPKDIQRYQRQIINSLTKFATKTFDYATKKLNKYWPSVAIRIAQRHIRALASNDLKSFPFDVPFEIRKELNLLGYTPMFHQITISRDYETPVKYYIANCNSTYCASIYKYFGFNLILTRVDRIQLRLKISSSKHWYQNNNVKIVKIIEQVLNDLKICENFWDPYGKLELVSAADFFKPRNENYNIDSLKDLHSKISTVIDFQNNFNTIIYARNYQLSGNPAVESSTSGMWEINMNAWQRITYKYTPPAIFFWRDLEVYEILLCI